jgi:hypothetical protein
MLLERGGLKRGILASPHSLPALGRGGLEAPERGLLIVRTAGVQRKRRDFLSVT